VQHAAVAAAGVESARRLLFEEGDGTPRLPTLELERERDPDYAAANDKEIRGLRYGVQAWTTLWAGE
jgi:hypothetical protein